MTVSENRSLQRALNDLFAWLVVQQENLELHGEADLDELEVHLAGVIGLLNPETATQAIKEEFEKLQIALAHFSQKIEERKQEMETDIQQINRRTQGIARYLQTAH